ncbi:ATP-binding protein [Paracoccus luteus]|uniref:ATP-binding protein n=1 Tax=Paracoccus luteus TaxID=2508543 RepID=UPI00106F8507|nr:ATP-binding protein [Paracoccus luteus]
MVKTSAHFETLFTAIDQGYCLCEIIRDADGRAVDYRFLDTNPQFDTMTGLASAVGRTARELVPDLEEEWFQTYGAVAAGTPARFQSHSAPMGRWFDVFATPVAPQGHFALVFRDITAQRRAEAERAEATARAERLLVEVNHRVMNTLAMIGSIVRMEAQLLDPDDPGSAPIARLQNRLQAVSTLYRALSNTAAVEMVEAAPYLSQVVNAVAGSIGQPGQVEIDCQVAPLTLPTAQAAPLGLLVNELMTNAMKYAFPDARPGRLTVALDRGADNRLRLTVADDGVGVEAAAAGPGDARPRGVGSLLVAAFAEQLGGQLHRDSGPAGTTVIVTWPDTGSGPGQGA